MASQRTSPGRPVDPHNTKTDKKAGKGAPPPFTSTSGKKKATAYEWEAALADAMKIPYTANVKKFFDGWTSMEQSNAANNPFNISVDYTGKAIGTMQSSGPGATHIQMYGTALDGIIATAAFILKNDVAVRNALKVGNFQAAAYALDSGHWAPADKAYGQHIYNAFLAGTYSPGSNAPTTLSPKSKAQVEVAAATIKAQMEAASTTYIQSQVDLATAKAQAKAAVHINDPWITVVKDNKGNVRFGTATGYNAPKNALSYGGMALTQSQLSSVWGARYADIYEAYTGKVATPGAIVQVLSGGFSTYGLQAALAGGKLQSWKAFTQSPFYKQQIGQYQLSAQNILGTAAPKALIQKAFAEKWDQAAFEQNIRTYQAPDGSRPYLKGTEFTNNVASMQTTFQKIYGAPDDQAKQSIKEAAGNGWTQDAFATYLRQQPQYKTSIEYQSNAMNLMDNLGLLFRMAPVMKPVTVKQQPSGGNAVPNSPIVPGQAGTLNPELGEAAQFMKVGPGN